MMFNQDAAKKRSRFNTPANQIDHGAAFSFPYNANRNYTDFSNPMPSSGFDRPGQGSGFSLADRPSSSFAPLQPPSFLDPSRQPKFGSNQGQSDNRHLPYYQTREAQNQSQSGDDFITSRLLQMSAEGSKNPKNVEAFMKRGIGFNNERKGGQGPRGGGGGNNFNKPKSEPKFEPQPAKRAKVELSFEDMFTHQMTTEAGVKFYYCKVCKVGNQAEINIKQHQEGRKHKKAEEEIGHTLVGSSKLDKEMGLTAQTIEPTKHESQFNSIIAGVQRPFIGLTYCIEILDPILKEPFFICVLCEKKCDPRMMPNHFSSQNHRSNYVDKHFPTLAKILHEKPRYEEEIQYRAAILEKIATKIQARFGLDQAFIYEGSDYETTKQTLHAQALAREHIGEANIPNSEVILIEGIDFEKIEPLPKYKDEPMKAKMKQTKPLQERLLDYKGRATQRTVECDKLLKGYLSDPGSHPSYAEEWQKFWDRKVEESGGKATQAQVLGEWNIFFGKFIEEHSKKDLEAQLEKARNDLGLSLDDVRSVEIKVRTDEEKREQEKLRKEKIERDREMKAERGQMRNEQGGKRNDRGGQQGFGARNAGFGYASQFDEPQNSRGRPQSSNFGGNSNFGRNSSNFGGNSSNFGGPSRFGGSSNSSSFGGNSNFGRNSSNFAQSRPQSSSGQSSVISTLRILLTLETELGLLAPKILELLSRALTSERLNPTSSDELLFNPEHYTLLEMAKEKLLGLEAANLVEFQKREAFERALSELMNLLDRQNAMEKVKDYFENTGKPNPSMDEIKSMMGMMFGKGGGGGGQRGNAMR